jgi:hypothetical protein
MSGTASGQSGVSNTAINNIWTNKVSDPWGGANTVLQFDGVGQINYMTDDGYSFDFGTGDFTIEGWAYSEAWTGAQLFAALFDVNSTGDIFHTGIAWNAGRDYVLRISGIGLQCYSRWELKKWHHWAVQRRNGLVSAYVNGVLDGPPVIWTTDADWNAMMFGGINESYGNTNYKWNGYMSDIRVSKGIARYGDISLRTTQQVVTSSNSDSQVVTSNSTFGSGDNFFTADAYTKLLLQGNSLTADQSSTPLTITNNGGTVLRQGVSAFGANSYYFDGTDDYLSAPDSDDWHLKTNESWTVECWFNADDTTSSGMISQRTSDSHKWMIGIDTNQLFFNTNSNLGTTAWIDGGHLNVANTTFNTSSWNHIAAVCDGNHNTTVFFNGTIIGETANSFDTSTSVTGLLEVGRQTGFGYYKGYMDGIHISKGIARYGYTGTNVKDGLNAVHHSHCKLLITSNTSHGNTHFDDFSDQGNYWNQTPYSYFFDGTNDYITTPSTTMGTTHCAAAWVAIDDTGSSGGIYGANGSTFALHHNTTGILVSAFNTAIYGTAPVAQLSQGSGRWHLVAVIRNGATTTNYVDGVQAATGNGGTTAFDSTKYIGRLGGTDTNWFNGRIAQLAAWNSYTGISAANIQSMWEAGPTANWLTDYSANMLQYYGMGNHNEIGGRPADTKEYVYDRSGNNNDGTTAGTMYTPNKGKLIIPVII